MAVIGVAILGVNRVARDAVFLDQRGGDVVLGRERIGGAAQHLGAAGLERAQQIGGLGGDMQAGAQALAAQRLLLGEALADDPQHRHLLVGPFDPAPPGLGESEVAHVMGQGASVA